MFYIYTRLYILLFFGLEAGVTVNGGLLRYTVTA